MRQVEEEEMAARYGLRAGETREGVEALAQVETLVSTATPCATPYF